MVRSSVLWFVSCIALVCIPIAMPSAVSGQTTSSYYTTAITQVYGSTYPLTGRLDLELFSDGTLRGYYHTAYYKLYIPVAGGRDGNYIWFDIGPSSLDLGLGAGPQGKLHVVATVNNDGSFRGQIYPETAAVLSGLSMQYQFSNPAPSVSNTTTNSSPNSTDQYIFTATPTSEVEATPKP